MVQLFFDLDGTLIDISEKYFRIYFDFMEKIGKEPMTKTEFWRRKRRKDSMISILGKGIFDEYKTFFIERIEREDYLQWDRPFDSVHEIIRQIQDIGHQVYLMTLRRNSKSLLLQISQLGFTFFDEVLTAAPPLFRSEENYLYKIQLIEKIAKKGDWIIGDGKADVLCAHHFGLKCAALLTGISDESFLRNLSPSYLLRSLKELSPLIT